MLVQFEGADSGWCCWIEGREDDQWIGGWTLNGAIADLVGYDIAHEEWPTWIDRWADEIIEATQKG